MNLATTMVVLAAGGASGSVLRGWLGERFATLLPWTTLFINVTGSFASGWLNGHYAGEPDKAWLLTLLVTGACGGYTTFSTLAFQLLVMWRERRSGRLLFYLALTLSLGLAAAWAGLEMGRSA